MSHGSDDERRPVEADPVGHARGSMLLVVGRLIGMAVGMVIQLSMLRVLSPDEYGSLMWALSVGSLVQALATLGLDRISGQLMAEADEHGDDRRLVGVLVLQVAVIWILGLLAVFVAWSLQGSLYPGAAPSGAAEAVLPITLLLTIFAALDATGESLFAVFANPKAIFTRRYLLDPVLRLLAVLVVFVIGGTAFNMALALLAASVFGVTMYSVMGYRQLKSHGVLDRLDGGIDLRVTDTLALSIPMITTTLVWVVNNQLPFLVVGIHGSASDVASLRAVYPIASLPETIMTPFLTMLLPLLARLWVQQRTHELNDTFWRTNLLASVVALPVLLLAVAFPEVTSATLLGEDYRSSWPYLLIAAAGYWIGIGAAPAGSLLVVAGRTRLVVMINVVIMAVAVGLLMLLVPPLGALGGAIAPAVSRIVGLALLTLGRRGIPVSRIERRLVVVYAKMLTPLPFLAVVGVVLPIGFLAAVTLVAVASLAVLVWLAPALGLKETLPFLAKVPVLGRALVR